MDNSADNVRSQMRKGVLEYCILSILEKKEAYASSILEELKAANMIVSIAHKTEEPGTSFVQVGRVHPRASQKILLHYRKRPSAAR